MFFIQSNLQLYVARFKKRKKNNVKGGLSISINGSSVHGGFQWLDG